MHMQGVGVVGAVVEGEAVALAFVQDEFVVVRVGLAVDGEGVELAGTASGDFLKDHVDILARLGRRPAAGLPKIV